MKKYGLFEVEWNESIQLYTRWIMIVIGVLYFIYIILTVTKEKKKQLDEQNESMKIIH